MDKIDKQLNKKKEMYKKENPTMLNKLKKRIKKFNNQNIHNITLDIVLDLYILCELSFDEIFDELKGAQEKIGKTNNWFLRKN